MNRRPKEVIEAEKAAKAERKAWQEQYRQRMVAYRAKVLAERDALVLLLVERLGDQLPMLANYLYDHQEDSRNLAEALRFRRPELFELDDEA
jgi:hypothetical protein